MPYRIVLRTVAGGQKVVETLSLSTTRARAEERRVIHLLMARENRLCCPDGMRFTDAVVEETA